MCVQFMHVYVCQPIMCLFRAPEMDLRFPKKNIQCHLFSFLPIFWQVLSHTFKFIGNSYLVYIFKLHAI